MTNYLFFDKVSRTALAMEILYSYWVVLRQKFNRGSVCLSKT
jgi:hypothetical protein